MWQEVEEFVKKVNSNGGHFKLHVYDDAGHAFLTSDDHRESKPSVLLPVSCCFSYNMEVCTEDQSSQNFATCCIACTGCTQFQQGTHIVSVKSLGFVKLIKL